MKEERKSFEDGDVKDMIDFYKGIDPSVVTTDTFLMLEELLLLREQVRKYA